MLFDEFGEVAVTFTFPIETVFGLPFLASFVIKFAIVFITEVQGNVVRVEQKGRHCRGDGRLGRSCYVQSYGG